MQEVVIDKKHSTIQSSNISQANAIRQIKVGIWIYLILLLFEGALRKWFLPSLATPLLVVRDPVALGVIFLSIHYRVLHWNLYLLLILLIGFSTLSLSLLVGHGNLYVALYGLRPILIHFPFMFVVASIFNRSDVEKVGNFLLWITPIMTLLIALQFYSPQSAWVNRGIGGDMAGAGFSGAMGYFRPPGTFSFTNGTTLFYSLVACFVFYFWLVKSNTSQWLLTLATVTVIVAIPLSISRAYFFQFIITTSFSLCCILANPRNLGKGLFIAFTLSLIFLALTQFSFFQIGLEAFSTRFETATEAEGGVNGVIGDRFLGGLFSAIFSAGEQPLWGYGVGLGSNAGSMLLTGEKAFLIAEGEWARILGELGPILGLSLILIRFVLGLNVFINSLQNLRSLRILPWILTSFAFLQITVAGWSQPTALGFSVFVGGLVLASFREPTPTDITDVKN